MYTIEEYDEQHDLFIIKSTSGALFPVDASAIANLLERYDEPDTFIGITFDVRAL